MMRIETNQPEETYCLGKQMGNQAAPGEIYCLDGDLGVGKTVFAQGFAVGLGIAEPICSPTFNLLLTYEEGRLPFYHFDLYRIESVEELYEIGYEDYFFGEGVCLIEWPERAIEILARDVKWISIQKDLAKGDNYRKISLETRGK